MGDRRRFWATAAVIGVALIAGWILENRLAPTHTQVWEGEGVRVEIETGGYAPDDRIKSVTWNGTPLQPAPQPEDGE